MVAGDNGMRTLLALMLSIVVASGAATISSNTVAVLKTELTTNSAAAAVSALGLADASQIANATNDLSAALEFRMDAGTNDLNTTLKAYADTKAASEAQKATNTIPAPALMGTVPLASLPSGGWTKQVIYGGANAGSDLPAATRYLGLSGRTAVNANATQSEQAAPVGGYLSNFTFVTSLAIPATTNIVLTVQTNVATATPVDSTLAVTLAGGGVSYTNSGNASVSLNTNVGSVIVVKIVPSAAVTFGSHTWTVEWWHQ